MDSIWKSSLERIVSIGSSVRKRRWKRELEVIVGGVR